MGENKNNELQDVYKLLISGQTVPTLGELLKKRKADTEISNAQLANILNMPYTTLDRVIKNIENGELGDVGLDLLLKLSYFLGIDIQQASQIYIASLSSDRVKGLESARKANFILNNFDVKALKKVGFINSIADFTEIENRIKSFFGLESIFEYSSEVGGVLFSRTKNISADKMRELWVRAAIFQFQRLNNPNEYDKNQLLSIIPKIKPYTRYEEKGFLTVIQALFNAGVTVIVQSYLSKTQVRGGTFVINNKPCIVITDFNKSYATLWFALLHELYHAIYDFDELKTLSYHLTGEEQSELYLFREDLADYFACEMLFPKENLSYIQHMIKSPNLVRDYAEKCKIHPSIVYSFYCREQEKKGKNYYGLYNQYFGKPDKAIHTIKTFPWDKESIYEDIERIRKILTPTI